MAIQRNAKIALSETRTQNRANTQSKLRLYGMGGGYVTAQISAVAAVSLDAALAKNLTRMCVTTAPTAAQEWTVPNEHSVFDIAAVYAVV